MIQRKIFLRGGLSIMLVILCLPWTGRSGWAQTPDDEMTFRRMGISPIEKEAGKNEGKGVDDSVEKAIRETLRFDAVPLKDPVRLPGRPDEIKAQGLNRNLDLILTGKIQPAGGKIKLTLAIFEGKSGKPFAMEFGVLDPKTGDSGWAGVVTDLVSKLVGRIPYRALVTGMNGDVLQLNAGRLSGIADGDSLEVIEVFDVKRHPFTGEAVGFRTRSVGRLKVVEAQDLYSRAVVIQAKKGKSVRVGSKIAFHPSKEALLRAENLKKEYLARQSVEVKKTEPIPAPKPAGSRTGANRFDLAVGTGLAQNFFRFESNELDFKRRTTVLMAIQVRGAAWLTRSLGIGFSFRQGNMKFDEIDGGSINVDSTARWLDGGIGYRFLIHRQEGGPVILLGAGYHQYRFEVNKQDDTFFNDYTLSGPFLGLGGNFPVVGPVGLRGGLMVFPVLQYKESGVDSGDAANIGGYLLRAGAYCMITDSIGVELMYGLERYHSKFDGTGSRGPSGVTDARINEIYNGFHLNLTGTF